MSVDLAERRARAALCRVVEPETRAVVELVQCHGAVEAWERLSTGRVALPARLAGLTARAAECRPDDDLERLERLGGRLVCPGDEEWPQQLDDLWLADSCPPFALWVRGPASLAQRCERSVAVVGSRAATDYGTYVAAELGAGLGTRGWSTISGGAYGIDGAAHRGALAVGAATVVVLASGVDVAYPRGHHGLFERVAEEHLLVSESALGCAPHRARFLVRNRLIAALTRGTVVVEAAVRSGALSTAGRAAALQRPLMAVPGPVTSTLSTGCHAWIRDRGAVLVCDAEQVLEQVGAVGEHLAPEQRGPTRPGDELSDEVRRVLEAVPVRRAAGPARIAVTAGADAAATLSALRTLQRAGYVVAVTDGWRLGPKARPGAGPADDKPAADAPQQVLDLEV